MDYKDIYPMRTASGRNALRDIVIQACKRLGGRSGLTIVEVGSYAGESSDVFACMDEVAKLWCVDPWKMGYDDGDLASHSDFSKVEARFDEVAKRHGTKISKFKGVLRDFVLHHGDICPDMVYIDACHTYEACRDDIAQALRLRPCIVCGHDYARNFPGVMKAVDEVFGSDGIDRFQDTSWMER